MAEQQKVKVKLTKRILVKGEGQKIGTVLTLDKNEALRLVHHQKATFDLDAKTAVDPTDVKADKK